MFKRLALTVLLSSPASAAVVEVATPARLDEALGAARPGDEIVLADGTYAFDASLSARANGTASQPITVRARNPRGAQLRFNTTEGFKVTGSYWIFDGLDVQGTCSADSDCEHAFHVTGDADHFVLRNSRLRDFNAQLKVNAAPNPDGTWAIPDQGLIERNEVFDSRPRNTANPVTKLNIDTGDGWIVRDNDIYDFHKSGGDGVSYGAFMKSGGTNGVFERNRVRCTNALTTGGTRIGLSFGGGGTAPAFCAPSFDPSVPCSTEHTNGILRNNVIVNCSDVGIYLNKAANTRVLFNTLIATAGVDYRFSSSSGDAHGNVLTSIVRTRDGASLQRGTNLENVSIATFSNWYENPLAGDLRVKGDWSALSDATASPEVSDDFCARTRPIAGGVTLGALEHSLGDCDEWPGRPQILADGGSVGPDGGTDGGSRGGGAYVPPGSGGGSSPDPETSGCGCTSGSGGIAGATVLLLTALRRRRRASSADMSAC